MTFEPRGKVAVLLEAMRASPEKVVWRAEEVAQVMEVARGNLPAYLQAVVTRGLLHRKIDGGKSFFSLKPFAASPGAGLDPRLIASPEYSAEERAAAAADVRAPKADPNWLPPKMIATRGDPQLVRAPLPAPSPTAPAPAPIQTCAPQPWPKIPNRSSLPRWSKNQKPPPSSTPPYGSMVTWTFMAWSKPRTVGIVCRPLKC